jgi:hypothetical protein
MPDEKKPIDAAAPEKPAEVAASESDFADEEKAPELPKEEAKPAEPAPEESEEKINLFKEPAGDEPAPTPEQTKEEAKKAAPSVYQYDDDNLAGIEKARLVFHDAYKKSGIIRWIVTAIVLVAIVLGYILPIVITDWNSYQMIITLVVLGVSIAILATYSILSNRSMKKVLATYINEYYRLTNAYVFAGQDITEVQGNVDTKLNPDDFKNADLYKDVYKVGSRESLTFKYKGLAVALADAAGQVKGAKSLQTVFVGKFIMAPNSYKGPSLIVYLKGNSRALPPTTISGTPLEDHRDFIVYGDKGAKKALSPKLRAALGQLNTNDTFVDCALSIQEGKTYIAMGYEDNLMILPEDKPFNPAPTEQFRSDFLKILNVIDVLNASEN